MKVVQLCVYLGLIYEVANIKFSSNIECISWSRNVSFITIKSQFEGILYVIYKKTWTIKKLL